MKKLITILLLFSIFGLIQAQNFQVLYGYGNGKPVNLIRSEIYKPLECGVFHYYTDFKMDFNGYFEAYTEVSKYWNITKNGVAGTLQYNVGLRSNDTESFRIDPVYLVGVQKTTKMWGWVLSLDILFRYDQYTSQSGGQVTLIYFKEWNKLLLSGNCDVWNSGLYNPNESPTVIMFEPQLFYSITDRFAVGVEVVLSNYTLASPYKDYIMGGIKWNLN